MLAIGLKEGRAQLVSVPDFSVVDTLHLGHVVDIDLSPDGRHITSVGGEHRVNIYDRQSGKSRVAVDNLSDHPILVRFSPDGERILTADLGGKVRLYVTETGDEAMRWDIPANGIPNGSFSLRGDAVVIGGLQFGKVLHAPFTKELRSMSAIQLRKKANTQ